MVDGLIDRVEREAGVSGLLEVLAERLAPTDLQSLLLEVYARRARAGSPGRLLEQYQKNRFVTPSEIDPRRLGEIDRLAWKLLPEGYVPLELAPLCPLGTNSVVATVSQNKVVSTIRNTEVVADSGRGYYDGACFTISATGSSGDELVLADGGLTAWTRHLLSDQKERLVISGLGVERLCASFSEGSS